MIILFSFDKCFYTQKLSKKIDEQNERIVNQNQTVIELTKKLEEKDIKITKQNKKILEQDKTIVAKNNEMKSQKNKIDTQEKLIADRDTEVNKQNVKIKDLQNKVLGKKMTCLFLLYFSYRKFTFFSLFINVFR